MKLTFGQVVRQLRNQAGHSVNKMGELLGMTGQNVSLIENGVNLLKRDPGVVAKYEAAFGLAAGELAKYLPADHPARKMAGANADLKMKLIGAVSAGSFEPLLAADAGEEIDIRERLADGSKVAVVTGHSCSRFGIFDGDLVLLRDSRTPEDGQFCVVETGEGMTLKWHWKGQLYRWLPDTPTPEVVPLGEDTNLLGVVILRIGKLSWDWDKVSALANMAPATPKPAVKKKGRK